MHAQTSVGKTVQGSKINKVSLLQLLKALVCPVLCFVGRFTSKCKVAYLGRQDFVSQSLLDNRKQVGGLTSPRGPEDFMNCHQNQKATKLSECQGQRKPLPCCA